jgi:hypothetical protein
MSFLSIENPPLSNLKPWTRNARTHSKKQIKQIAESITQFGFTNPVLIDRENTILAGHGYCLRKHQYAASSATSGNRDRIA